MTTSTHKPTEDAPEPARVCEGFLCGRFVDIRFDHTSKKWLCRDCWAKIDPVLYGIKRR